jgi:coenzyme F420-dependent glucose-6-phosphate dehydrogenase
MVWPDQRERFRRLSEAVKLIRKLWTTDFVEWDGEYYHVKGATLYDKPPIPIPIYVAATGPAAAKFAGRQAEGFICTSGKGIELYRDTLLPAVREGAAAEQRDYNDVEKTIELKVSFDQDRQKALDDCRFWAPLALPAEDKQDIHSPRDLEERATKVEHPERRWMVSDDPEEQLEQLATYIDLGFTHLIFHSPASDQAQFMKLYASQVIPRIRERWGQ